jgi:pimeloyl-ACP methyl ester carboxylesterase
VPRRSLPRAVAALLIAMIAAAAGPAAAAEEEPPPILFVHGNGDSAALWLTTIWRFESNGYDPALLAALDFTHPLARRDDTIAEANRSGTIDQAAELSAAVTRLLLATKRQKLVLVGSSRGGNAIRNYIRNAGGAATVETAILAGTPNHGVTALPGRAPNNEFSGLGPFLAGLNAGAEVTPGVRFLTLRSNRFDKYAQPVGDLVGLPGQKTGIDYDGPALAGAENIVLPGLDHRETAFHPLAFREMYRAVTGREPATLDPVPEERPVLDGMVSGWENGGPTNLPLAGARVEVYEVDAATGERRGAPAHARTTAADGRWGPFRASPAAYYEFVVAAPGYPVTHIYRTPFPRSSRYVQLRLRPADPKLKEAGSVVTLTRPRGYLGHGRDIFTIDGAVPDGVRTGVPADSTASRLYPAPPSRSVPVALNGERMTVRTGPLAEGHVVYAEFHY